MKPLFDCSFRHFYFLIFLFFWSLAFSLSFNSPFSLLNCYMYAIYFTASQSFLAYTYILFYIKPLLSLSICISIFQWFTSLSYENWGPMLSLIHFLERKNVGSDLSLQVTFLNINNEMHKTSFLRRDEKRLRRKERRYSSLMEEDKNPTEECTYMYTYCVHHTLSY